MAGAELNRPTHIERHIRIPLYYTMVTVKSKFLALVERLM
jgi:hypothetical protein